MQAGAGTLLAGRKFGACQGVMRQSLYSSRHGLRMLIPRRLHVGSRVVRPRGGPTAAQRPPRPPLHTRPHTTRATAKGNTHANLKWRMLILLMGKNCHLQTLENIRDAAYCLLKIVIRQCKVHTGERVRRSLQLYSAYSRMWGEEAAMRILSNLRRTLLSKGRHMLLSAVCIARFDWENEKISDEALQRAVSDLESVGELCKETVQCENCGKRQVIDQQMSHVDYCTCNGTVGYAGKNRAYDSWEPFIERDHHIVWRQRHHVHNHLFAYKVYGSYDDVSLRAFVEAQLNSSFRMEWDDSVLDLRVIDSQTESNSDLLYWLVKFPQFFSNRDYVFKRRSTYNAERREAVIISQAIDSNDFPEEKGIYRVKEYWSRMVIRARDDADKPGLEYTLTYFDNPGTSLPQSITNFVAASAFPNFLCKVHKAALSLQSAHNKGGDAYVSLPKELQDLEEKIKMLEIETEVIEEIQHPIDIPVTSQVTKDHFNKNQSKIEDIELGKAQELESAVEDSLIESKVEADNTDICEHTKNTEALSKELEKSESRNTHLDMTLHLSKKNVNVDVLEAMEVTAPDMDKKTKLSKKVEELTGSTLQTLENKFVLLEKLERIRSKLKTFQENAFQRKIDSIEKMKEFENRGHYDHTSTDEKTLKHLENLFKAVNKVLQDDKDMRTGKGYLQNSSKEVQREATKDANESENNSKKDKDTKSKPPDDPPGPDVTGSSADVLGAFSEESTSKERTENEIEGYSSIGNKESMNSSSWTSWSYIPFFSRGSDNKGDDDLLEAMQKNQEKLSTKEVGNNIDMHNETKTTFIAQAWYVIGLGWIFQTKTSSAKDDNLAACNEVLEKADGNGAKNINHEKGTEGTSWYLYPVNGVYKLYSWVFDASQEENV